MTVTTYTTVNGQIFCQATAGVVTHLIPDTLGSVIETRDEAGNKTSETTYWPYGEVRTQTGTNPTPWGFVGTLGYYIDGIAGLYVRARHLMSRLARWLTKDPLWPLFPAYEYSKRSPLRFVDVRGFFPITLQRPPTWLLPAVQPMPAPVRPPIVPKGGIGVGGFGPGSIPGLSMLFGGLTCGYDAAKVGLYGSQDTWDEATRSKYVQWCEGCCNTLLSAAMGGVGGWLGVIVAGIAMPGVGLVGGAIGGAIGGGLGALVGHMIGDAVCPSLCDPLFPPVPPCGSGPSHDLPIKIHPDVPIPRYFA